MSVDLMSFPIFLLLTGAENIFVRFGRVLLCLPPSPSCPAVSLSKDTELGGGQDLCPAGDPCPVTLPSAPAGCQLPSGTSKATRSQRQHLQSRIFPAAISLQSALQVTSSLPPFPLHSAGSWLAQVMPIHLWMARGVPQVLPESTT